MDSFCGAKFWDWNVTWYTPNGTLPSFTRCFQNTTLVFIPAGFLFIFALVDILYSSQNHRKGREIPRSPLSTVKYGLTFVLCVVQFCLLHYTELNYPVDYFAPLVRLISYVVYCGLLYYSRLHGVRSSGVQFIFWLLHTFSETFKVISDLDSWQNDQIGEGFPLTQEIFVLEVISSACVWGMLLLNCWADLPPKFKMPLDVVEVYMKKCPKANASFLSKILFEWFTPMAWLGFRKPLDYANLWELNEEDKSSTIVPLFEKYWKKEVEKKEKKAQSKAEKKVTYSKINGNANVNGDVKEKEEEGEILASIMPALFGAFGTTFFVGAALKLVPDSLAFVSPQILKLLIAYTESDEEVWKGLFYAVILLLCGIFGSIISSQYNYRMFLTGMRVRTALLNAIYRKALVISSQARKESTVGEIVNLMSVDIQKFMDLIPFVNMAWSAPLQIAAAMYFLWGILGPATLSGVAVLVLMIPVNAVIAGVSRKLHAQQMKKKDLRIKMMNEILGGIKVLKLYAWEESFEEQIMKIRREEIALLRKAAILSSVTIFLWTCAPFLVALSTFGTYVLLDDNNVLDAQKAFVSLALFNLISLPLTFLPIIIMHLAQASVSLNRLNKYMNAEEMEVNAVSHDASDDYCITVDNGTFAWEPHPHALPTLRNINLQVKKGSLVAVVGTVGAGKSSLLSVLIGELYKLDGRVDTKGRIAYVSQQAWIQNTSLRDNILFGSQYDRTRYQKVISACALQPDIDILPAGDKTEIGEKGINLSGGQKQRVSLARAVYNNADIYLLDDPLSAVDSHVGKHIFDQVIGPQGALVGKTRVIVTHGIVYLPQVDNIVVIKDGQVSEMGSYKELVTSKGAFAEFLEQHNTNKEQKEEGEEMDAISSLRRRLSSTARQQSITESIDGRKSIVPATGELIEKEKSETESVKASVYLDFFKSAGWYMSIGTVILYIVFQGFSIGANMWLSHWSNQPVVNGTQANAHMYLGVYAGFGFMQAIFIMCASVTMELGTLRAASKLHYRMFVRILHAPMSFFDTTPLGRIVNRFARDVDVCDTMLSRHARMWLTSFFSVMATLIVICYSTPFFMVLIFPVGTLYYLVQRFYVSTSRQLKRLESASRSPIYSHFGETLGGASTIRAYSAQTRFIQESEGKVDYNQLSHFPAIVAQRWLSIRLETIGNIIIFSAALLAVLGRDWLTPGLVGLSLSYALQITVALSMMVRHTSDVETNIVAVERIKEYGEVEQEADFKIEGRKPPKSWPQSGQVTFQNYATRYRPGMELVLKDVTCTINPGEKVGIVGRTGAGKSSLTLALFRIIEPAGGTIVIDGEDICRLGLHDVRGRITIIPQDPVLFSGSLRLNLDPFEQYQDSTIWRCLELAHLSDFVKSLQAGLSHEISEGGENLSVGQRQLICLTRALLRKTKILVLDEATAAVDLETDHLIQQTIRKEFIDSTVITIAHRLNTIMDSTRVMVLANGEIKEFDSPQNLLNKPQSIFYSMAKDSGLVQTSFKKS